MIQLFKFIHPEDFILLYMDFDEIYISIILRTNIYLCSDMSKSKLTPEYYG